jgi:hypothetical protein
MLLMVFFLSSNIFYVTLACVITKCLENAPTPWRDFIVLRAVANDRCCVLYYYEEVFVR